MDSASGQVIGDDQRSVEREKLRAIMHGLYAKMGFEYNPDATADDSVQLSIQDGVRAEDNTFSCGILAARDEE